MMASLQLEEKDEKLAIPQFYMTAKDELIQTLTLSLQDLKQELALAQQKITVNEVEIKNISSRVNNLEDGVTVTQQGLDETAIQRIHIKQDLIKQCEEYYEKLSEMFATFCQFINETLMETQSLNKKNVESTKKLYKRQQLSKRRYKKI